MGDQFQTHQFAIVRRDDKRLRKRRHGVNTRRPQHVQQTQHASERVTVGRDVTRERDGLSTTRRRPNRFGRLGQRRAVFALGSSLLVKQHNWVGHSSSSKVSVRRPPSRKIASIRAPVSIDGSGTNTNFGIARTRMPSPSTLRKCGATASSAA